MSESRAPRFERPDARAAEIAERYASLDDGGSSGDVVKVAGRVVARRDSGKLVFVVVQDATGRIQLFCSASELGVDGMEIAKGCDLGDWLWAEGEVMKTKRGEISVRASRLKLVSKAQRALPDKWHGLTDTETRYRQRYLDLIVNEESRRRLRVKAAVLEVVRRILRERGFLEVETPILQPLPGGATARPFVTHYGALDTDVYLRVAPELYLKRLLVGGVDRIFELGRCFRNEGVSTRHNPEFTMLEVYQAFADYNDMMELVEEIVTVAAAEICGSSKLTYAGREVDLGRPWRRIQLFEAASSAVGEELTIDMPRADIASIAEKAGIEVDEAWGVGKIAFVLYDKLAEATIWDPTFVLGYPVEVSPLALEDPHRPGIAERFEAVVVGREFANAFSELTDPVEQRKRLEAQALRRAAGDPEAMQVDEDFLRALEHGMPPAGGMGMGIDRLVMLLSDAQSIRESITFPQLRPET